MKSTPLIAFRIATVLLATASTADRALLNAQQPAQAAADRMIAVAIGPSANSSSTTPPGNAVDRICASGGPENLPAWDVPGWEAYGRLWEEFRSDPDSPILRKYLGLPVGESADDSPVAIRSARGRSAPDWLGWRSGTYRQVETPHLQIFSHADDQTTRLVATDMERVFWVWTQLFFPLWESQPQVALHLRDVGANQSVASTLARKPARLSTRRKLRVVLLSDAADYAKTLGQSMPGIEQSTGFYSDKLRTSFFYPSDSADAVASRRHELVHQLFREATRSRLAVDSPGEQSDFWLIEGIAGYFESLHLDQFRATVGGWDSPRLQFARFRVLGGSDFITLAELRDGGQLAVQNRSDLARWYANAIAYTHLFLDGDSTRNRRWVYQLLAGLYEIPIEIPGVAAPESPERSLVEFLKIDDQVLLANPTTRPWTELCFSGCETTARGLASVVESNDCRWIDLSRQPVVVSDLTRLCPDPGRLDQLSLEATQIDDSVGDWIGKANALRELDLSWTACGDRTIAAIANHPHLQTLWLTGSKITDASVPTLAAIGTLQSLDVQRTQISAAALARLKTLRPDCKINPLQLRVQ